MPSEEAGKHRDPLDRRRGRNEEAKPEVLGVDIKARVREQELEILNVKRSLRAQES